MTNNDIAIIARIACIETQSIAVNDISKAHKINPAHIAASIPGLMHTHPPCDKIVKTCHHCQTYGNVFDETHIVSSEPLSAYERAVYDSLMKIYGDTITISTRIINK